MSLKLEDTFRYIKDDLKKLPDLFGYEYPLYQIRATYLVASACCRIAEAIEFQAAIIEAADPGK